MIAEGGWMPTSRKFGSTSQAAVGQLKLLHDARRRLKARLEARGFGVPEILDSFSAR